MGRTLAGPILNPGGNPNAPAGTSLPDVHFNEHNPVAAALQSLRDEAASGTPGGFLSGALYESLTGRDPHGLIEGDLKSKLPQSEHRGIHFEHDPATGGLREISDPNKK